MRPEPNPVETQLRALEGESLPSGGPRFLFAASPFPGSALRALAEEDEDLAGAAHAVCRRCKDVVCHVFEFAHDPLEALSFLSCYGWPTPLEHLSASVAAALASSPSAVSAVDLAALPKHLLTCDSSFLSHCGQLDGPPLHWLERRGVVLTHAEWRRFDTAADFELCDPGFGEALTRFELASESPALVSPITVPKEDERRRGLRAAIRTAGRKILGPRGVDTVEELLSRYLPGVNAALTAIAEIPLLGLMIVIATGFTLGRVRVRGLSLGPAGGTLFAGLMFGRLGLPTASTADAGPSLVAALGFALFLYAVGFDAAPHFFASFRERRGWRYLGIAIVVNAVALVVAVGAGKLFGLAPSSTAGLLAGALTSAPTFAAAAEIADDPTGLALSFALCYPFGLAGVVLGVQLLPRWLGEDLARGSASNAETTADSRGIASDGSPELKRVYRVESPEIAGRTLSELSLTRTTGCVIAFLHRGGATVVPTAETVLELGDHVLAVGRIEEQQVFEQLVGPETSDTNLVESTHPARRIELRRREACGKTLAELAITRRHHCVVTRIDRGRLWIEPDSDAVLAPGDVLEAVGERDDLRALASELGRFEQSFRHTDVATYAAGIVLGLLLGAVRLPLGGLHVGLGFAGGLLVAGLLFGSRPRIGPLRTHVPAEARQLVRDLGILLFIGEAGLRAGARLAETGLADAFPVLASGAVVTLASLLIPLLLARKAFGLRPVEAWGSVAGGLTSSAALHAVREASDSNEPAIPYAAAYALASILATIAGPLAILLLR